MQAQVKREALGNGNLSLLRIGRVVMRFRIRAMLLILGVAVLSGCEWPTAPEPNIILDQALTANGYFTFHLPGNMKGECGYGADTYVGYYEGGGLRMWFDLGPPSMTGSLSSFHSQFKNTLQCRISNRPCEIAMEYRPQADSLHPYASCIVFPDVSDTLHWTLWMGLHGATRQSFDAARAVFLSIRLTM